jgi:hypothetical protein
VTKPGNSDPADRPADAADTEAGTEAEPTPAEATVAEPGTPEAAREAAPDNESEDKTEPEAKPEPKSEPVAKAKAKRKPEAKPEPADEPEPLMVELEKAPPIREEPVMPTAAEAARRRSDLPRPKVLRIALYFALASAAVGLYSAIELFLNKAELVESAQTIKTERPLTAEEAERAVTSLLWLYLVVVLALGAFVTLFVYKAQEGVRRARMMALIITIILMLFHFYFFGTAFGQISGLFAAVTIALLYLPSTREYFGPRQTVR